MRHLLITPGEPSGIGPDIVIQIAQQPWQACLTVVADPVLLLERAQQTSLPIQIIEVTATTPPTPHIPGTLRVLPVKLRTQAVPGVLDPANASYVIETLAVATALCKNNKMNGVVTGPVHKGVINDAGIAFTGHTEFFASETGVKNTVMLFVVGNLKVALTTTHLPLKDVSKAITPALLNQTLTILNASLQQAFGIATPRILVCGLNPHAGENGYLGKEELDTIIPAINGLIKTGMTLKGPLPADTIFTPKFLQKADAVLAMYHDQALPLVKYIGFGNAVNMTLGLPFIRTSVDHGTAVDVAGSGHADAGSMEAAIHLAIKLALTPPSLIG